jgi:hypothetical protein
MQRQTGTLCTHCPQEALRRRKVMKMQQQPLLTADEVIELLEKEALPQADEEWRKTFKELVKETKLSSGSYDDPYTALPILQHCVDFLESKGIYVYFYKSIVEDTLTFNMKAGECGRVFAEVCYLAHYLNDLKWFLHDNTGILPPEFVAAEEKRIESYQKRLYGEIFYPLGNAYHEGDKVTIKALLEKAQKLVEEINESIKDLRRLHALAMQL